MKTSRLLLILLALLTLSVPATAQQEAEQPQQQSTSVRSKLTAETAFGTDVVDRAMVGEAKSFPATVGKVYFWTKIEGAEEPTAIRHVWYYQGKEMASIELAVRDKSWRTWSYKTIIPEWTGEWTVVVSDDQGREVTTASFTVTAD